MQCIQQSMGGIFLMLLQAWSLKPDAELSQVVFEVQRRHEEHVGAAPRAAAAPALCTPPSPRLLVIDAWAQGALFPNCKVVTL
jgi:hypothetical protein